MGLRRGLCSRQTAQSRNPGAQTPSGSLGDTVGRCGNPSVCLYHRGDRGPGRGRVEGWPNWGSWSLCPAPSLTALPAGCRSCPSSCACYDSTGAQDQAPEAVGSRGALCVPRAAAGRPWAVTAQLCWTPFPGRSPAVAASPDLNLLGFTGPFEVHLFLLHCKGKPPANQCRGAWPTLPGPPSGDPPRLAMLSRGEGGALPRKSVNLLKQFHTHKAAEKSAQGS